MSNNTVHSIRFFPVQSYNGFDNMAIDETLALSTKAKNNHAYLRFYKWNPPTLTFGYNQKIEKIVDSDLCAKSNISLVKRMTGGKMVFHDEELTFSMGFPINSLLHKLPEKYRFIDVFTLLMQPLLNSFKEMGLPVRFSSGIEMNKQSRNRIHCYAAAAGHSIFLGNKKLVGAAGIIRDKFITVHGSIPINISCPPSKLFVNLVDPVDEVDMASLSEHLSLKQIEEFPGIAASNFAEYFKVDIFKESLSEVEKELVRLLSEKKYSNLNWSKRTLNDDMAALFETLVGKLN